MDTPYNVKQIKRTLVDKCSASPEKVFPLLCPVRELEWIPGWEYEMIHSSSGFNEEGCIFKTQKPYNTETIWYTTEWDPKDFVVEFVMFARDMLIIKMRVSLKNNFDGTSIQAWELTFTPISEKGNVFVEGYTEEKFKKVQGGVLKALNYYLETGKKLA